MGRAVATRSCPALRLLARHRRPFPAIISAAQCVVGCASTPYPPLCHQESAMSRFTLTSLLLGLLILSPAAIGLGRRCRPGAAGFATDQGSRRAGGDLGRPDLRRIGRGGSPSRLRLAASREQWVVDHKFVQEARPRARGLHHLRCFAGHVPCMVLPCQRPRLGT